MKKNILVFATLVFASSLFAQNKKDSTYTRPLYSLNLNLLGDASLISFHFEQLFPVNSYTMISGKFGVG